MERKPEGKFAKFSGVVIGLFILAIMGAVTFKVVRWIIGY